MNRSNGYDLMGSDEAGSTLLLAMVVLLGLSLAAITAIYLARTDTQISGNLAYRNAAMEATNVALQQAGAQLESAMAQSSQVLEYQNTTASTFSWYQAVTATNVSGASPPDINYWNNCQNNAQLDKRCAVINVNPGSYKFIVQYFVQPTGLVDMNPKGTDQFYTVYYRVYAHARNANNGTTAADVEATYRHYVPKNS